MSKENGTKKLNKKFKKKEKTLCKETRE